MDYYQKYMKYKLKYIHLKEQLGSGGKKKPITPLQRCKNINRAIDDAKDEIKRSTDKDTRKKYEKQLKDEEENFKKLECKKKL